MPAILHNGNLVEFQTQAEEKAVGDEVKAGESNIPGLEALKTADGAIIFTRFQAAEAEPKGELDHVNVYTLVVAVALSAQATDATMRGLQRLYGGRRDLDWARAELDKAQADGPDPEARLALAERILLEPLDRAAEASVIRASRNVAAATALIPLELADVLAHA